MISRDKKKTNRLIQTKYANSGFKNSINKGKKLIHRLKFQFITNSSSQ